MKALLILKDLQPNRPDKATYLANHKKMGCKLLEIMADGLYAVFHRFEAFLKKG